MAELPPLASLFVEPVGPAHRPLLAAMHALCFTPGWSESTIADLLSMPGSFALIGMVPAATGVEPIGFTLARVAADEAELLSIGVLPDCRRGGVARRLVAACVERAGAAGAGALFLEVGEANLPARALYDQLGFQAVGRRERYYRTATGDFEAALVLRRDLIA